MLGGVQVEHELAERPFEPRQGAGEDDEARAGNLGGALEIHLAHRLAELVMLLRVEGEVALVAMAAHFHIGVLVGADRHAVEGQVRQDRKRVLQFGVEPAAIVFLVLHGRLDRRDFGLELLGELSVLGAERFADFLGGSVAALLQRLQFADQFAALAVDLQEFGRHRRRAARTHRVVESSGVFANPFDVEHDRLPGSESGGVKAVRGTQDAEPDSAGGASSAAPSCRLSRDRSMRRASQTETS